MVISLPKPNEIVKSTLINPRVLLIYGEPKIGKTTLASQLKDSLLIDLEDGSDYLNATKIKVHSLQELNDVGGEILKNGKPYKYLLLDTATEMELWCEDEATKMYKASVVGKNFKEASVLSLPKGAGYYWLRKAYGLYFKALSTLSPHLIVIAHVRDKMLVGKDGREVEATDLDLTGKLRQITCSKADAIGYLYRKIVGAEKGKPLTELRISFTSGSVNSGARCQHLINQDFVFDWDKIFLKEN